MIDDRGEIVAPDQVHGVGIYPSIAASAAAFCAFSRVRLQMAATSQPSERKPGAWTCAPKPTPMMPTLRVDEATSCSRFADQLRTRYYRRGTPLTR